MPEDTLPAGEEEHNGILRGEDKMRAFMDENFMLHSETAQRLYHTFAEGMPILDYHCHISPEEIARDRRFENLTQVWLGGDHYKWRLMRANGVEERYITGDASDREKFQKWAETLELAVGNPVYHWSHLELRRFFGYQGVLNGKTAREVWELTSEKLADSGMNARNLILQSHVKLICTTDDPADDLVWHKKLAGDDSFPVQVLPAWRPDRAMNLEKPDYPEYLERLSQAAGRQITSFGELKEALRDRMDFFGSMGCRASDHGVEYVMYAPADEKEIEEIFSRRLSGAACGQEDCRKFKTAFLQFAAKEYAARGWVMQLHFGCKRDNNRRMYRLLGPDTGYDCVDNHTPARELADFLDSLEERSALPRTILYSLNANDDDMIDSVIGCFQNSDAVGKLQHGAAWWFNDHSAGMKKQMISLANGGLLGNFVGMLTDSRSFLSYPRHEYFRRILCDLIGQWVEDGEYPMDEENLERIIRGICYENAVRYFGFRV